MGDRVTKEPEDHWTEEWIADARSMPMSSELFRFLRAKYGIGLGECKRLIFYAQRGPGAYEKHVEAIVESLNQIERLDEAAGGRMVGVEDTEHE